MQVSRILQRCLGTCAHRDAGILSNEIDAHASDYGTGVVFVQIVEGEAVVEQNRRLLEDLTSQVKVDRADPVCCGWVITSTRFLPVGSDGWPSQAARD